MDLKINFPQIDTTRKFSLADSVVGFENFSYRHKKYDSLDLSKKKLLVLIYELNKENEELSKRIDDLNEEITIIKRVLEEYKDYFNELEAI